MSGWQDAFAGKATSGTKRTYNVYAGNPPVFVRAATKKENAALNALNGTAAPSTPNLREHWSERAKRAKRQRAEGKRLGLDELGRVGPLVCITITRVAPRQLDSDNLAAAMKSIRDGIADALRIDDGSGLVEWKYTQRKGNPWVEVTMEAQSR